jgi:SsrA-binding protein
MKIENRKAKHDYFVEDKYIAGIVLTGTEIKSIRRGNASLVDTFCTVKSGEIWVHNSYIAKFEYGSYNNHDERRLRKLLLTKREIEKIHKKVQQKGYTIVPLKMFINDNGLCKVELGICIGKKEYDKRETIKERDLSREMQRCKY